MNELILDDVYDVWFTSFWQTWPGYAILITSVVVTVFVLYSIVKVIARYRRGTRKDRALRHLAGLMKRVEHEEVPARFIYREITDTAKRFSEWRYHLPRGMTDAELVSSLKEYHTAQNPAPTLEDVISHAQSVKFGHVVASKQQILEDIAAVISFIKAVGNQIDT